MRTILRNLVIGAVLGTLALGCGTSSPPRETTPGPGPESAVSRMASFGPQCPASYEPDADITIVVVPWAGDRVVGLVLPGSAWEGSCTDDPAALLTANDANMQRMGTVTLDTTAPGDVDVRAYADAQRDHVLEALRAEGVMAEASPVQHAGDGIYALTLQIQLPDGQTLLQVSAYHVLPTDRGLLRYHLSELGVDAERLRAHAGTLLDSVRAFEVGRADQ
ncbi:MAG: hypothetical protein KC668_01620 [Myxococcales bacterium]|nr:hypothetical protein [Myxococcales bacterium]